MAGWSSKIVGIVALALAAGGWFVAASAQEESDDRAAIEAVLAGYAAAVARSDIDGMAAHLDTSEDFSVIEGGHANWGWTDYRDHHLVPEFTSEDFRILDYGISDIRLHAGDKLAYAVYRYRIAAEVKSERRERTGLATAVLVKTSTGWKIRHLHS